jgi:hypothetical protein
MAETVNLELGTNIEITMIGTDTEVVRFAVTGELKDVKRASEYLAQTQNGTIVYRDETEDPEDPNWFVYWIEF